MKRKSNQYGLLFYLITMVVFILFPKQILGNLYLIAIYIGASIILLYIAIYNKKKQVSENENRITNLKARKIGLWYYVTTTSFFFISPKQTWGNIYVVTLHLLVCLVLLYFIYFKKPVGTKP